MVRAAPPDLAATRRRSHELAPGPRRPRAASFLDKPPKQSKLRQRIFDRDEVMHQSKGTATIFKEQTNWMLLLFRSPIIFVIDQPTWVVFFFCFIIYTISFLFFMPFYYWMSDSCGLEMDSWTDAYYLSLQTIITIGYGVPDQYYNECVEGTVLLTVQSVVGRILDALLMGLCIIRLARGSRRVCSTIFTDKAFLNFKQGKLFLSFQIAEMRDDVPFEAHVRVYVIRHVEHPARTIYYQTSPVRLLHPDDELSGMLFLHMPTTVLHEVDPWSPLYPPDFLRRRRNTNSMNHFRYPMPLQRNADRESGGNSQYICNACGETYETLAQLHKHIRFSLVDDRLSGHDACTSCWVCGESYPTLANLRLHSLETGHAFIDGGHKRVPAYGYCVECGEDYSSAQQLALHWKETGHNKQKQAKSNRRSGSGSGSGSGSSVGVQLAHEAERQRLNTYLQKESRLLEMTSEAAAVEAVRQAQVAQAKLPRTATGGAAGAGGSASGRNSSDSSSSNSGSGSSSGGGSGSGSGPISFSDVDAAVNLQVDTLRANIDADADRGADRDAGAGRADLEDEAGVGVGSEEMERRARERRRQEWEQRRQARAKAQAAADRARDGECAKVMRRKMEMGAVLGSSAAERQVAHSEVAHSVVYGGQADGTWEAPDPLPTEREFEEYFRSSELEVVVIVEGVDPVTANTVQARHSYTVDDMVWGQRPVQCVFRSALATTAGGGQAVSGDGRSSPAGVRRSTSKSSDSSNGLPSFASFRRSPKKRSVKMGCVVDYGLFHKYEPDDSDENEFWPTQSV